MYEKRDNKEKLTANVFRSFRSRGVEKYINCFAARADVKMCATHQFFFIHQRDLCSVMCCLFSCGEPSSHSTAVGVSTLRRRVNRTFTL